VSGSVEVVNQTAEELRSEPVVELVEAVLAAEGVEGLVVIAFVEKAVIEDLNTVYRETAGPTDVLSFRYAREEGDWVDAELEGETVGEMELGEIVICPAVVWRYAEEEDRAPAWQLWWTLIHGTLHLIGYDHEADEGEMRTREDALMDELASLLSPDLLTGRTGESPDS
jgi:probable rRNA maturation factor